jgi:tRNA-splicing ligase RtcB
MNPKAFHELLKSNKFIERKRAEAWRLYKEEGPEEALEFVQSIEAKFLESSYEIQLRNEPVPYKVWGSEQIEKGALDQMKGAARLPVAVAGSLMPDAHSGYGLPIGGVLATDNVVIPYAVGVDIACRMMLTVYPVSPHLLRQPNSPEFQILQDALVSNTYFGIGAKHEGKIDHPILDKSYWQSTNLTRRLRDKAIYQIGTSGTGNHFVEWGEMEVTIENNPLKLAKGLYLALLSHSGSRVVGSDIANYYTQLAMNLLPDLDESIKHLAWLPLNQGPGEEYWDAMQLAGKFASANHHIIHERVAQAAGLQAIAAIENHHNFAWREKIIVNGLEREVIVHRKGATPAGRGVLGIIPGTMADKGYVVIGKGCPESLNSASHGSGRQMSRKAAKQQISLQQQKNYLEQHGVTLIGGGLDEAPQAYKPIQQVIEAQRELVDILGVFQPRIVRIADEEETYIKKFRK